MAAPFTFDCGNTERSAADAALAQVGWTEAKRAAAAANRADVSVNMVGIGPSAPSQNPMQINAPQAPYSQPNPAPAPTTTAPPANVNAMQIPATSPAPYVQPDYRVPTKANPGVVSRSNPMGL